MKRTSIRLCLAAMATFIALTPWDARGDDWPEWRGKGRHGVWNETGILERFPSDGLEIKWRVPVGSGYGGPAVADGRVLVTDWQRGEGNEGIEGTEGPEQGGGDQQGNLTSGLNCYEGGAQRDFCLTESNIAADHAVHGLCRLQVADDGLYGALLIRRFLEWET